MLSKWSWKQNDYFCIWSNCIIFVISVAPSEVKILGHQNAKAGDTITMSCESSNSNPAALITWFSRGRQLTGEGIVTKTKPSPRGGFISYSNITVTLTNQESKVIYSCHGTNDALGVTVMATAELSVQCKFGTIIRRLIILYKTHQISIW